MFCYYLSQYPIKEQLADCAQRESLNGRKRKYVERGTLKNKASYFVKCEPTRYIKLLTLHSSEKKCHRNSKQIFTIKAIAHSSSSRN